MSDRTRAGAARRQQARRQHDRRNHRLGAGVVVAAVALLAVLVVAKRAGDRRSAPPSPTGSRVGSRVASTQTPLAVTGVAPATYRITYRTDGGAGAVVGTTELEVRRPFDARQTARKGPPPGGARLGNDLVQTLGRYQQGALVLAVPPSPASLDLQPDGALAALVQSHQLARRERRTVAGRPCQVYRAANDPTAAPATAWKEGERSWTDVCLGSDGLLLEVVTVGDGKVLRRRVATKVETGITADEATFTVTGTPVPVQKGGGAFERLTADSRLPDRFWELPAPPEGFTLVGRYLSRPPQPELINNVNRERNLLGGVADVYVRGGDAIIIEQGSTMAGGEPFDDQPAAQAVDLGALGPGQEILSLGASVVRVDLGRGAYVRLAGTVAPSELVTLARSLVAGPGGTLTVEN